MFINEFPQCSLRFGRVEHGTSRFILTCGYNEVEPEDCIICGGSKKAKLEIRVHTYIRVIKRKR